MASNIQHTKRIRSVALSSVACLILPYFSTLSQKRYYFRENVTEHKMCVLIFIQVLSAIVLILRRNEWNIIIVYIGLNVKYPLVLSDLMKIKFSW